MDNKRFSVHRICPIIIVSSGRIATFQICIQGKTMKIDKSFQKNPASPALWMMSGIFSWYLYTYVFAGRGLPVIPGVINTLENSGAPRLLMPVFCVLIPHIPEYLLCFVFCFLLCLFSQFSRFGIIAFIIAANAVPLYYQLMQIYGYYKYYHDLQTAAPIMMGIGLMSTIVISPLFALMGGLAGNMDKQSKTPHITPS